MADYSDSYEYALSNLIIKPDWNHEKGMWWFAETTDGESYGSGPTIELALVDLIGTLLERMDNR